MFNIIPLLIIFIIFYIGAQTYWDACISVQQFNRYKKNRYKDVKETIIREFGEEIKTDVFEGTGFSMSMLKYNFLRYTILIIWAVYMLYQKFSLNTYNNFILLLWIAVLVITSPKKNFLNNKSPFSYFVEWLKSSYQDKIDREVYRAISQLKNLSIAKESESVSSDYILEELKKYTKITKPIFGRTLSLWYDAKYEEASMYFQEAIGTDEGKALGSLFKTLDHLKPNEIIKQLELHQKNVREKRKTEIQRKKDRKSYYIYAVVIFTVTTILANFIVISIVIDAIGMYQNVK